MFSISRASVLVVSLFLLLSHGLFAQKANMELSPKAEISLITCAPGSALFEAFGHSAIRVHDPLRNFDKAYNYGVFDFNQPNFYLNFAKGYLLYMLGTADFQRFLYQYAYFDRTVKEQQLNLSQAQKQSVFAFLETNSLPENREYYYDYFFDNCATRPRDVFVELLGDSIQFDYGFADSLNYTIRGLIDRYIEEDAQYAWGDLGIDLGLGANIDRPATPFEYMYQPEFLYLAFDGGTITNQNGKTLPLVKNRRTLYQQKNASTEEASLFTPSFVFWLILIIMSIITFMEWKKGRYFLLFADFLLLCLIGLYGLVVIFLWFFTNHTAAANNWNLFWAIPTHFFISFFLLIKKPFNFLPMYFIFSAILCLLLLALWNWLPQDLHHALIPLLILIILRSFSIIKLKYMARKA